MLIGNGLLSLLLYFFISSLNLFGLKVRASSKSKLIDLWLSLVCCRGLYSPMNVALWIESLLCMVVDFDCIGPLWLLARGREMLTAMKPLMDLIVCCINNNLAYILLANCA